MIWKFIIVLALFAIILGGVVWIAHGRHIFTKTREQVVTIVKDDLFGTERQEKTWVDKFKLGLLPDDASITVIHRSYAFIVAASLSVIIISTIMLRRKNKNESG